MEKKSARIFFIRKSTLPFKSGINIHKSRTISRENASKVFAPAASTTTKDIEYEYLGKILSIGVLIKKYGRTNFNWCLFHFS